MFTDAAKQQGEQASSVGVGNPPAQPAGRMAKCVSDGRFFHHLQSGICGHAPNAQPRPSTVNSTAGQNSSLPSTKRRR
jgi:hypothetical protein